MAISRSFAALGAASPITPPPIGDGEIDIGALWHFLVKRRVPIVATMLCSVVLSALFVLFAPGSSNAVATLEARPLALQSKQEDSFGRVISDGSINVLSEEDIATTMAKLLRHDFLAKVAASTALQDALKRDFPGAVQTAENGESGPGKTLEAHIIGYLQGNVSIVSVPKTRLIDVTASHRDAKIAVLIADTFTRVVIEDGLASRAAFAGQKIEDLQRDFNDIDAQMDEAQRRLALYLRSAELRKALVETRNGIKTLAGRYKEKHPKMMDATRVLKAQEEALLAELERIRTDSVDAPYWSASWRQIAPGDAEGILKAENFLTGRYEALLTEMSELSMTHSALSVRLNEVRIANNVPDLDLRLAQSAVPTAAFPIKKAAIPAGLVLGAILGIVLAHIAALVRPRVADSTDWRSATSLPLLGLIAEFPSSEPPVATIANSPPSEDVRNLRSRLICGLTGQPSSILVTSPLPGDGKTSLATSLARSLAQIHPHETVLVDLDLQCPSIHEILHVPGHMGTAEVLLGRCSLDDALALTDGLMVLTAGDAVLEALNQLGSNALPSLITELKRRFRHVIIDCSPVLLTADTLLIAPLCDGVLLVVNALRTPTPAIRQAEMELISANGKIRGGILNQIAKSDPKAPFRIEYLLKIATQSPRQFNPFKLRAAPISRRANGDRENA